MADGMDASSNGYAVPMLLTDEHYTKLAQDAVNHWANLAVERCGFGILERMRKFLRAERAALKNVKGLDDSGEMQFAFTMPTHVENYLAMVTGDPDWPRTFPKLLREVVRAFDMGLMGSYEGMADVGGGRDFGCSLGQGDVD